MDLKVYKGIDPDTLMHEASNKITFFFIPDGNELLYDGDDPYITHQEMLQKDEDGDDFIFNAVYPQYAKLPDYKKEPYRSRGEALKHSNAIIGRLGFYKGDMVVAVWNSLVSNPNASKFKSKMLETFPALKKHEVILVSKIDDDPELLNAPKNAPQRQKQDVGIDHEKTVKKYVIGGQKYSHSDIHNFRASKHSGWLPGAQMVLCHPDMNKYPELSGFRIPCGDERSPTRQRAVDPRDPYRGKYGESFADFLLDKTVPSW